jgi:hypothetical protein
MLRPLVRLLLEKQLSYTALTKQLKALYVEVAERDLALPGRRPTDSRISLLTGVHRREVKRIRSELHGEGRPPARISLGALLISRWTADPAYLDADGRPRRLPKRAAGSEPSFEALVVSASTDLPPRSVLDEWLRLGVVELDEQGRVRLVEESFVPEQGYEEKLHFFGRNLREHVATGARNLLGAEPPYLDRSVYYDGLSKESIEDLAAFTREEGADLLRRVNQRALELQRADADRGHATQRMTFGSYFYAVDELDESQAAEDDDDDD